MASHQIAGWPFAHRHAAACEPERLRLWQQPPVGWPSFSYYLKLQKHLPISRI